MKIVASQWLFVLALANAVCAHAGPMGFKDSWMAMGDLGPTGGKRG